MKNANKPIWLIILLNLGLLLSFNTMAYDSQVSEQTSPCLINNASRTPALHYNSGEYGVSENYINDIHLFTCFDDLGGSYPMLDENGNPIIYRSGGSIRDDEGSIQDCLLLLLAASLLYAVYLRKERK